MSGALPLLLVTGLAVTRAFCADRSYPEISLDTVGLVRRAGYPVEIHEVDSEGYILTLHRIPPLKTGTRFRLPVFLQHGMLCSSDSWVLAGPGHALGFLLADLGYDVWMGNARGNTFSRRHRFLSDSSPKFWNFSWHEMGTEDLPRVIDYVLKKTGHEQLQYVGHSMGTTMFYVMASMLPQYNAKIRAMFSLAPVAYMGNIRSLVGGFGTNIRENVWRLLNRLSINLFAYNQDNGAFWQKLCGEKSIFRDICAQVYFSVVGHDKHQLDKSRLPLFITRVQHGVTLKSLSHYRQLILSGEFGAMDLGKEGNLKRYGTERAPNYNVSRITAPIALFYGENDYLVNKQGTMKLASQLPNVIGVYVVPHKHFNHMDFLWAKDVRRLVYDKLLVLMDHY